MFDPRTLAQFADWFEDESGTRSGLEDIVGGVVGPAATVAVAGFLWPRFIRVEGHVLLEDRYEPAAFAAWRSRGLPRPELEALVNHIHLWDVFPDADEIPLRALEFLGSVIAETWPAAARRAFPEERFTATYSTDPDEYGPTVVVHSIV